jgi:hypothetical protein
MPCNNGNYDAGKEVIYREINDPRDRAEIDKLKHLLLGQNVEVVSLKERNKGLEAGLCALIMELEKRGIANEIIQDANKNGMINISDFWEHHSTEDETRLAVQLHKFSEHEQEVLKRLLNKK